MKPTTKKYVIFAIKGTSTEEITMGAKVVRNKETIAASKDISFVATDGAKMFIVGDAETLNGIKPSDTGCGSTCGATPTKVQELADILTSMDYSVDVTIAYEAIDKITVYPKNPDTSSVPNGSADDGVYYELVVPSDKENMIEEALELAAEIGNVDCDADAFVVMCEFYLKSFKKA